MNTDTAVALAHADEYDVPALKAGIEKVFDAVSFTPRRGSRVIVKPNYVTAKRAVISCTHPAFIRAVCEYLIDHGAGVAVGDSPAFGSAAKVAGANGTIDALAGLGVPVVEFTSGPKVSLTMGGSVRVARQPAEADLVVNLPKLKAHTQMRITAGVKNFFGCVVGVRKAMNHAMRGDRENRFESMITDVMLAMRPSVTVLDGIEAMSRTGPSNGDPCRLNLIAASHNPVALDTAILSMLGLAPADVPLWSEAARRGLPGAGLDELTFPLDQPGGFDVSAFVVPGSLDPQMFSLPRLAMGAVRRAWRMLT